MGQNERCDLGRDRSAGSGRPSIGRTRLTPSGASDRRPSPITASPGGPTADPEGFRASRDALLDFLHPAGGEIGVAASSFDAEERTASACLDPVGTVPSGMVAVDGGRYRAVDQSSAACCHARFLFHRPHRSHQRRVQGVRRRRGYARKEGRREFRQGNRVLPEKAMDLLVDSTGRPGPATWEVGNFPPASGLSGRRRELAARRRLTLPSEARVYHGVSLAPRRAPQQRARHVAGDGDRSPEHFGATAPLAWGRILASAPPVPPTWRVTFASGAGMLRESFAILSAVLGTSPRLHVQAALRMDPSTGLRQQTVSVA